MSSIKNKILLSILVIIALMIAMGGKSVQAKYDWVTNITSKDPADIAKIARDNGEQWYGFDPKDVVGKTLKAGDAPFDWKGMYCIDEHGPTSIPGAGYKIVNVIDVATQFTEEYPTGIQTVYGVNSNNKVTVKNYGIGDSKSKSAKQLAYLASESFTKGETTVSSNYTVGTNKLAMAVMFWFNWSDLDKLGMSQSLKPTKTYASQIGIPSVQAVINKSTDYAKKMQQLQFEDKTVEDKLEIEVKDGKTYIGPYRIKYNACSIDSISVKGPNGGNKTVLGIADGVGKKTKAVTKTPKNGDKFYVVVDGEVNSVSEVKIKTNQLEFAKTRTMVLLGYNGRQNMIIFNGSKDKRKLELSLPAVQVIGLEVIKVDKATGEKLKDIGFKIYNQDTKKWVVKSNGKISYVANESKATVFKTNAEGSFKIEDLKAGQYSLKEVSLGSYTIYKLPEGFKKENIKLAAKFGIKQVTVKNSPDEEQKPINISGYVWEDMIGGKASGSTRNNFFKIDNTDTEDLLLDGITVRLKDRTKQGDDAIVQSTTTSQLNRYTDSGHNGHGEYLFTEVDPDELKNYYIEFEYDGMIYKSMDVWNNVDRGSKAYETAASLANRETFNNNFAEVEGSGGNVSRDTGYTRDTQGNQKYELKYKIEDYKATYLDNANFKAIANTDTTGDASKTPINLDTLYKENSYVEEIDGVKEIRFINLGLVRREPTNIDLKKDVESVVVTINGKKFVYIYGSKTVEQVNANNFNLGAEFKSKRNDKYSRAIYKEDTEYTGSGELEVYINYKITAQNGSAKDLTVKVNSIADYYDARYTLESVGKEIDKEKGTIKEESRISGEDIQDSSYGENTDYRKVLINTNMEVAPASTSSPIYVQFKLGREAVYKIINANEDETVDPDVLYNVAEINSYSTIKDNKAYAAVDEKSAPGNCIPGDTKTYELDTDTAPALKLFPTDARTLTGTVFFDETSGELMTGEERRGNGIYDPDEKGVSGVTVKLKETLGSQKEYLTTTDENGYYKFTGYIPGDYTVEFTWGEEKGSYDVQDYKGTIYLEQARQTNTLWYKKENKYSDAMDDWNTRKEIDKQVINGLQEGESEIKEMASTTPKFNVEVEYLPSKFIQATDGRLEYPITDIDFGIVERPRQEIQMKKQIKSMKVISAYATTLAEIEFNDDGTVKKSEGPITGGELLGYVKAEMDNEALNGATVKITYKITVTNVSEIDYISDNGEYYFYGTGEGDLVKLKVSTIKEYFDNNLVFDITNWQEDTTDVLTTQDGVSRTAYAKAINETLEPTKSWSIEVTGSKELDSISDFNFLNDAKTEKIETVSDSTILFGRKASDVTVTSINAMITPSTGDNRGYVLPVIIGITSLVILAGGIVFVKKKVIDK